VSRLLELLELLVYCLAQTAAPTNHPRAMETDAKDKSDEIGSPGFKPLDARAAGKPETVRIARTTSKQLLGISGSASLRVSNFERRGRRWASVESAQATTGLETAAAKSESFEQTI
jgi:hypothetical protein